MFGSNHKFFLENWYKGTPSPFWRIETLLKMVFITDGSLQIF